MKKIFTLFAILSFHGTTFSQGHYTRSAFNPGDYFAPHAGWIIPIYYGYANMNYYNASGNRSDVLINPVPGNPTS